MGTEMVQAISTLGFPIVACGAMAYYVKYITDKHSKEMESITTALNNNTIALTKLSEKLDK